jgi:hypothetical protein
MKRIQNRWSGRREGTLPWFCERGGSGASGGNGGCGDPERLGTVGAVFQAFIFTSLGACEY